jgi:hypothetical protein
MPFRINCPACSAILNLKDELAGRAVKCPRCGDLVPATATQPPAPAAAFEVVEDDAPPAPPSPAAKSKAAPAAKPQPAATLDEDDEDDPRPKRRGKPAGSKRGKLIVLGMVGYWVLAVAGSLWLNYRGTNRINLPAVGLGSSGTPSNSSQKNTPKNLRAAYDTLLPRMPRTQLEEKLGPGQVMSATDYTTESVAFRNDTDWKEQVDRGRVLFWKSGSDRVFVCLTQDGARLQARKLYYPGGSGSVTGVVDDETFARENGDPLPAKLRDDPNWSGVKTLHTTSLLQEFRSDPSRAAHRYENLWIVVMGHIHDIESDGKTGVIVVLRGPAESPNTVVRVAIDPPSVEKTLNSAIGDSVTIRAKCVGLKDGVLTFTAGRAPQASGANPGRVQTSALGVLLSFAQNAKTAEENYKGRSIRLNAGVIESREADGTLVLAPSSGKSPLRIRVTFGPTWKEAFGRFKEGETIHIRCVSGFHGQPGHVREGVAGACPVSRFPRSSTMARTTALRAVPSAIPFSTAATPNVVAHCPANR